MLFLNVWTNNFTIGMVINIAKTPQINISKFFSGVMKEYLARVNALIHLIYVWMKYAANSCRHVRMSAAVEIHPFFSRKLLKMHEAKYEPMDKVDEKEKRKKNNVLSLYCRLTLRRSWKKSWE